jgi:hypothetical protein
MNAKDEEKQKRVDPFSDSKELFAKIFKEAIREIELERRGKKQAAASRVSTSSGGSQPIERCRRKKRVPCHR